MERNDPMTMSRLKAYRRNASAIENLQLAHWCCNRQKSDKLVEKQVFDQKVEAVSNRVLPQTFDWKSI